MTDPYRIPSPDSDPATSRPTTSRSAARRPALSRGALALRALLWLVLMASAVVNLIANSIDRAWPLGLASGGVAVVCIAALIVHHVSRRKT
ncbi:hypothetical protein ABZ815_38195 [Nonomuraea sp. NPDC047529]|uniref:hypothetical protein n=1 Tax=Nonomuraea sp. NPDC047529 TaxID=3155623 RepID=UPI00340A3BA2